MREGSEHKCRMDLSTFAGEPVLKKLACLGGSGAQISTVNACCSMLGCYSMFWAAEQLLGGWLWDVTEQGTGCWHTCRGEADHRNTLPGYATRVPWDRLLDPPG
eukprot:332436-Rhodomonas_salina.1